MEIRLLLVADFANVDTAGKLNIIGAFNQISPNQFPYRHPLMYVVFRIGATLGEFHRERTFKVVLRNEDAQEQWTTPDMAFQIPPPEGGRTAEFNAVIGIQGLTGGLACS